MSLLIIFFVLFSALFFGTPLLMLFGAIKDNDKRYLFAPFIGLSIIVLFLQNLVYLNIPIKHSYWILWLIGLLLWIAVIYFKKFIAPSKKILLVFLSAFISLIISGGWGYIYTDYNDCYGECWQDQYNYVAQSQLLVDRPFNTTFQDINNKPYLIQGVVGKESRIGQDVINGFFAATTSSNTSNFFSTVILLLPFLLTISMYLLSSKFLDDQIALYTAILAGISPIITKIHLENFLSQSIFIPFLFIIPSLIFLIIEKKKFFDYLILSIIITTAISIYFEFTAVILGIVTLSIISALCNYNHHIKGHAKRLVLYTILLPIIVFLLNPTYASKLLSETVWVNYLNVGLLDHIYPFAFERTMIPIIFWGDTILKDIINSLNTWWGEKTLFVLNMSSFLLFFISIVGWGNRFIKEKFKNIPLIICLGILLVPLTFFASPKDLPYQFFKLFAATFPLLILGLVIGVNDMLETMKFKKTAFSLFFLTLFVIFTIADISLTLPTLRADGIITYTANEGYNIYKDTKFKEARKFLSTLKNTNLVIDPSSNHIINAWLSYFARENNIWLLSNNYVDIGTLKSRGNNGDIFLNLDHVPTNALLYSYSDNSLKPFNRTEAEKIRETKRYLKKL